MNALVRFHSGMLKLPLGVKLWLLLLMAGNLFVPLFYLDHLEAKVVVATFVVSFLLMVLITALTGFTRLLGAGHVLWLPLIYFLWLQLGDIPLDDFYGVWVRALMGINAISLVIDSIEVARYVSGARTEIVEGLAGSNTLHKH